MATTKRDYYEVLDVARTATKEEVKKAFRQKARALHPDVNKNADAADRFKEINEAYEVLSNDQSRAAYDRFGHASVQGSAGFQDFGATMTDIFEEFFGGLGGRSRRGPRRGPDLSYNLAIEFEEAVFGAEKNIQVQRPEICPSCHGSGAEPGTAPVRCTTCNGAGEVRRVRQSILGSFVNVSACPTCQGSGEMIVAPCRTCDGRKQVQQTRTLAVRIPPGVDSETQIRLTGEGAPGIDGGPPGNLYVVLTVRKHAHFQRRGDDILLDLEINVAQAALGDEVTVPTVNGDEKLTIPPGTQTGAVFRLRARGVPFLRRAGRGDQLVITNVSIPKSLTPDQERLFSELGRTLGKEIIPQREKGILSQLKEALGDVLGI